MRSPKGISPKIWWITDRPGPDSDRNPEKITGRCICYLFAFVSFERAIQIYLLFLWRTLFALYIDVF